MVSPPSVVIWRARRDHHTFRCTVEQVGEEWFELRLLRGHELLILESFDEPRPLLARAEQLRQEIALSGTHEERVG